MDLYDLDMIISVGYRGKAGNSLAFVYRKK